MEKKRLISLMLAGAIVTSVGVMAGCDNNIEDNIGYNQYKNVYIVLNENGKDILHKGNFYDSIKDPDNKFALNCLDENHIITNSKFLVIENKPEEKFYDEICEDCFSK